MNNLQKHQKFGTYLFLLILFLISPANHSEVYESPDDFVSRHFDHEPPNSKVLYPDQPLREQIKKVLGGRNYAKFRIRYWLKDSRSVWILEEIGKERPITFGFVVAPQGIEEVRVLIYRETRGWEVRYDFFTRQFVDAKVTTALKLNRKVDNITGATLSVRAMKKMATLAVLFHDKVT